MTTSEIINPRFEKATEIQVKAFFADHAFHVADDYVDFLVTYNGGTVRSSKLIAALTDETRDAQEFALREFYPFAEIQNLFLFYYNEFANSAVKEYQVIPIATVMRSTMICLGIGAENCGTIYSWNGTTDVRRIAESLTQFFNSVREDLNFGR